MRLTVHIDDGQVSTGNHHPLAHHQPQAPRAASDDADIALQREGRQGRVDLEASTAGADDGPRAGELVVLWVLDRDTIIGTGEGAGVAGLALVPVASLWTLPRLLHVGTDLVVLGGEEGSGGRCRPTSCGGDGGGRSYCWPPADGSQGCARSSGEGGHGESWVLQTETNSFDGMLRECLWIRFESLVTEFESQDGRHQSCLICNGALSTWKEDAGRQVVGRVCVDLQLGKSK